MLDNNVVEEEKEFILEFAERWNMHLDWQELEQGLRSTEGLSAIRDNVVAYLNTQPPAQQLSQFADILGLFIAVDQDIDEREQIMLDEISALIQNHISSEGSPEYYAAVVPQALGQEDNVKTIFPNLKKQEKVLGGYAYLDGPFFSEQFVTTVCKKYHDVDLFAVPVRSHQIFE
jgi:hypothetical protein